MFWTVSLHCILVAMCSELQVFLVCVINLLRTGVCHGGYNYYSNSCGGSIFHFEGSDREAPQRRMQRRLCRLFGLCRLPFRLRSLGAAGEGRLSSKYSAQ